MIQIADTNEFHPMEGYVGPVIIRTGYSTTHTDKAWAGDAPKAQAQSWWGAYHYLAQNDDPVAAADAMLHILGSYRPNVLCCDDEEGGGDQAPRVTAFVGRLHSVISNIPDWTYSGLYFARNHDLQPQWLAAYQGTEPSDAHTLWQYTDKQQFPGMSAPCDASQFDGTLEELIALTGGNVALTKDDIMAVADEVQRRMENTAKIVVAGTVAAYDGGVGSVADQLAKLGGSAPGGSLTDKQVHDIVRYEIDQTKLGH